MERISPTLQSVIFLLTLSTVLGAFQLVHWLHDIDRYQGLESRITQYYTTETHREWSKAYDFYTPEFREKFTKKKFTSRKKDANLYWQLGSFEIQYAVQKNDRVKVKMELFGTEIKPGDQRNVSDVTADSLTVSDDIRKKIAWSIWMKTQGNWYAWQTSSDDLKSFTYSIETEDPFQTAPKPKWAMLDGK